MTVTLPVLSLRVGFFHESKEMRAACLRALRYYLQDAEDVHALIRLNIHYLIARSDSLMEI